MTQAENPVESARQAEEKLQIPRKSTLRHLGFLFGFLRPYGGQVAAALVALVIAAGATLACIGAMRLIIDHGFSAEDPSAINKYFLGLMGVVAVLAVATATRFFLVARLGERVVADLRGAVYGHVVNLGAKFFEENRSGELASRLTADTTLIQTVVGSSASIALRNVLTLIGGSILLLFTSPKLAGLVAIGIPVVMVPLLLFGRRVRKLARFSQDRVADVGAAASETLGAVKTVQAFNQELAESEKFAVMANRAFRVAVRRIGARSLLTGIVILVIFAAIDLVLWTGARDVMTGRMTGGELAAFVGYSFLVAGAFGALSESYGDFMSAAGAAGRMLELMNTEPEIKAPAHPIAFPEPPKGEVVFDHVTFRYPSRPDMAAIDDLSFTVKPGETVALVGPSGAGKSTVFQLLLRFYDPQAGEIRVDGVPIPKADPAALRARMGLVPQDTTIFAASARENILYGRTDATEDDILAAIEAAAASDFLQALPDGLDTEMGERGVKLSGGQRQRIAIARALLRDAPILLLDEATSALDAESEQQVQRALENLMRNRTTLVIAHRLATVKNADRILVLEEGRIVAEGQHDDLIREGGLYARLARLQFEQANALPIKARSA